MITLFAVLAWITTWSVIALRLRKRPTKSPSTSFLNLAWMASLILHGASILMPWMESHVWSIDFFSTLSIILWLTCLLLFLTNLNRPMETLGLFVLPLAPVAIIAANLLHHAASTMALQNGLGVHILTSLLAYSMLTLAAIQAMVLSLQNQQLHNHNPRGLIRSLPPLQDMEALLFKLILLGVILLSLSLVSGFIYLDGFFGKQVAHKTILSIIAWLTFSTLLYGHWQYGWRGRKAIRWTLVGFVLLLLAFMGSKFIFEYLVRQP